MSSVHAALEEVRTELLEARKKLDAFKTTYPQVDTADWDLEKLDDHLFNALSKIGI